MNDLKNQEIQYVRLLYKVIVNLLLFSKDNAATATTWALPGMPSIQNLIPTTYLGTTPMAGAGLGIFMGVEISVLCIGYVWLCLRRAKKNGQHFLPEGAAVAEPEPPGGKRESG